MLPASLYATVDGINLTVQAACKVITASFNRLSQQALKVRDMPSCGGGLASGPNQRKAFHACFMLIVFDIFVLNH